MSQSPARRRYTIRTAIAMVVFLASFAFAKYSFDQRQVGGAMATILALLPGLAVAGVFWALGRLVIEESDEFRKVLLVREILVATGVTMTVATIWGFLAEFGIVEPGHAFYLVWLFFFAQGLGGIYNRVTLGQGGGC